MQLPENVRRAIVAEAKKRGSDQAAAIAEAERLFASDDTVAEPSGDATAPARPIADRLLIGFLPFIKVKELRTLWLGLTDSVPDEDMMCGDFAVKHGGGPAGAPPADGTGE